MAARGEEDASEKPTQSNDYVAVIQSFAGGGGQGLVYIAALPDHPEKRFAIKILRRGASPGETSEICAYQRLQWDSPYVLKVWSPLRSLDQCDFSSLPKAEIPDFLEDLERPVILPMEFCQTDLLRLKRVLGKFTHELTCHCCDQIVQALEFAHSKGVAHGDIKPANVLVGMDGNLRIADWGSAVITEAGSETAYTTDIGGTDQYVAPEVITQHNPRTPDLEPMYEWDAFDSDTWSLGICMYVFLAGSLPFKKASLEDPHFLGFLIATDQLLNMVHLVYNIAIANFRQDGRQLVDWPTLWRKYERSSKDLKTFEWPSHFGEQCIDLLKRMITVDPTHRITLDRVRAHPYFESVTKSGDILFKGSDALKKASYGSYSHTFEAKLDNCNTTAEEDVCTVRRRRSTCVDTPALIRMGSETIPALDTNTFPFSALPRRSEILTVLSSDIENEYYMYDDNSIPNRFSACRTARQPVSKNRRYIGDRSRREEIGCWQKFRRKISIIC